MFDCGGVHAIAERLSKNKNAPGYVRFNTMPVIGDFCLI